MRNTDVVVIGGGQAGLAMSRCLFDARIDHVVLERGRVAQRWRSERWDSLRLLTPSWQSRLPGWRYRGADPDGFLDMAEVVAFLEGYGRSFDAPVEEGTTVFSVGRRDGRYLVATDRGTWRARCVVIATGQNGTPVVPSFASSLAGDIEQVVPSRYRNPSQIADGGVLVVGASATGVQLADELAAAGREVTLAVGRHTRLPRRYAGRDIMWWLDAMGIMDERPTDVPDVEASRAQPSLQLVGRPDHADLDLDVLRRRGVRIVGRMLGVEGSGGRLVELSGDVDEQILRADRKLSRLLDRIDRFRGLAATDASERPKPIRSAVQARTRIDLREARIRTVVWATGFRPSLPWLTVPGALEHRGGVTRAPGLYLLGFNFMRRRKSSYLDGVGSDARDLCAEIAATLGQHVERAA